MFSGSVRSAADLFVEPGEQEGGSILDQRCGQYFYDRIHSREEYLEPDVLSRLVEDSGCFYCVCGIAVCAGGLSSLSLCLLYLLFKL